MTTWISSQAFRPSRRVRSMRDGNTFADTVIIDEESGSWAELVAFTGRQP